MVFKYIIVNRENEQACCINFGVSQKRYFMAVLDSYNINAMATNISREFYINENPQEDKSYVLYDEMRLFAMDMKSRVTFISRAKQTE